MYSSKTSNLATDKFSDRGKDIPISDDMNYNLNKLGAIFVYPENKDFIVRDVNISSLDCDGKLIYLLGTASTDLIQTDIIKPLQRKVTPSFINTEIDVGTYLIRNVISSRNVKMVDTYKQIVDEIVNGNTILLVYGYTRAISISSTEFESRSVEKPTVENSIRGPKESFTESCTVNKSLIRKYLKDPKLVCESLVMEGSVYNEVFILYIKDIASPELISDIKKRIYKIKSDNIQSLSYLEQYIEDKTYSIVPTMLFTERPDRVAAFLQEGHIAIAMQGSPYCLIAPITFWNLFHVPIDQYYRWPYGNFSRIFRALATFLALLTPGLYLAISSYHIDMLPTDLTLAIAASREKLPLPSTLEVLVMQLAFDLMREAGIAAPSLLGNTIGIVGALILGQAAVEANIVSPINVIVVSVTGLASFGITDSSLYFLIRLSSYILLFAGSFLGFFGVSACFTILLAYISTVESFGVPFLSPTTPFYKSSKDTIMKPAIRKQSIRPLNMHPLDKIRSRKRNGD
ncbi:spore germination protein [Clostridium omnivorum]|uniref:Spore germination protein n=1 Tax=Clostridium omnivorum TaxID=1604902 RepID=A0ABQ5NBE9_9CLOT|nr:spore germination protein [Clostridium sp. E14]GLC32592.1 spore germination protein [Clostridium sp. E14]